MENFVYMMRGYPASVVQAGHQRAQLIDRQGMPFGFYGCVDFSGLQMRAVQYSDKFMHGIVLYYIHLTID